MDFALISFSPSDPTQSARQSVFTVQAGQVILAAFMWIDTPSAAGSSGVLSGSGDSSTLFSVNVTPEAGTYGPGLVRAVSVLAGGDTVRVCQSAETFTLVWTPNGAPGTVAPVVRVAVLTEQVF